MSMIDAIIAAAMMGGGGGGGATDAQVAAAVAAYLAENPVEGGGSSEWRHIRTVTIPEDPSTDTSGVVFVEKTGAETTNYTFFVDTDEKGEPFALSELFIHYNAASSHTSAGLQINTGSTYSNASTNGMPNVSGIGVSDNKKYGFALWEWYGGRIVGTGYWNQGTSSGALQVIRNFVTRNKGYMTGISVSMGNNLAKYGFTPGSVFEIYGR